jgi:hypothetical protein
MLRSTGDLQVFPALRPISAKRAIFRGNGPGGTRRHGRHVKNLSIFKYL